MKMGKLLITILSFLGASYVFASKPNIIVFLVDDMGAMDTSVPFIADNDGNPKKYPLNEMYHTPAMERLSATGCRFSEAYAMSVCSPSRVSIMTGQNSARHGVTNWINCNENNGGKFGPKDWNWTGLKSTDMTMPALLRDAGYKTIHVGKAHFGPLGYEGSNPLNLGFDVNIAGCAWGAPGSYLGKNNFSGKNGKAAVPDLEEYCGRDIFLTDALTIEAERQLDKCVKKKEPFFLYMSHYAVHQPCEPDKRFIANYEKYRNSTSASWPAFGSMIESMDKSLGDILDYLNKKGIAEDTLIIFLGDNGSDARILPVTEVEGPNTAKIANAAPLRGMKASKYEGGMRIPFIVSWAKPNKNNENQKKLPIKGGVFEEGMVAVYDILPTVMSITSTEFDNSKIDGVDLSPVLKGEKKADYNRKFLMHFPHEHRCRYFTTLREGDWKLIRNYENNTFELYNLKNDMSESDNLAGKMPEKVASMCKDMEQMLKDEGAKMPNL